MPLTTATRNGTLAAEARAARATWSSGPGRPKVPAAAVGLPTATPMATAAIRRHDRSAVRQTSGSRTVSRPAGQTTGPAGRTGALRRTEAGRHRSAAFRQLTAASHQTALSPRTAVSRQATGTSSQATALARHATAAFRHLIATGSTAGGPGHASRTQSSTASFAPTADDRSRSHSIRNDRTHRDRTRRGTAQLSRAQRHPPPTV